MNKFVQVDSFPFEQGWKQGFADLVLSLRDYGLIVAANFCLIGIACLAVILPQPFVIALMITCLVLGLLLVLEQTKRFQSAPQAAVAGLAYNAINLETAMLDKEDFAGADIEARIDAEYEDVENEVEEQLERKRKDLIAGLREHYERLYAEVMLGKQEGFSYRINSTDAVILDAIHALSRLIHQDYRIPSHAVLITSLLEIRSKLEILLSQREQELKRELGKPKTPNPKRAD